MIDRAGQIWTYRGNDGFTSTYVAVRLHHTREWWWMLKLDDGCLYTWYDHLQGGSWENLRNFERLL